MMSEKDFCTMQKRFFWLFSGHHLNIWQRHETDLFRCVLLSGLLLHLVINVILHLTLNWNLFLFKSAKIFVLSFQMMLIMTSNFYFS